MDKDKIKGLAFKTMANRKAQLYREKGFIYYHCERTANLAINLRKKIIPNNSLKDNILYVGALFHDIAKGVEPHNQNGYILVKEILKGYCKEPDIEEISQLVKYHNLRDKSKNYSDEIKILQDADILEHMGSIEVWLKFIYSGYKEESVHDALRFWRSDFYKEYLEKSKDMLNYDMSKKVFNDKEDFLNKFISRFSIEIDGGIFI